MSTQYNQTIDNITFLVGEINGYKCKNINALCSELRETFRWPDNESCIDAMYSLDWCDESNFKIIVNKFDSIKDERQKKLIQDNLNSYKEHWDEKRLKTNPDTNIFLIEYR